MYVKRIIKNLSSYETFFIAELILEFYAIFKCEEGLQSKWIHISSLILYAFIGMLLIFLIYINTKNLNKHEEIKVTYKLEKYCIIPINMIKNIFLFILNFIFVLKGLFEWNVFLLHFIILTLFALANTKYYSVILNLKAEVTMDELRF